VRRRAVAALRCRWRLALRSRWHAPSRSPAGGGRQGGFTLVEMLIALLVMLVGMLIVADLLDESARLLHHSVRRSRDGFATLAGELLRNDLRGAVVAPANDGSWEHAPLRLVTGDGAVTWRRRGQDVERDAGGAGRSLLRRVTAFRWRVLRGPDGAAVEVEIAREITGGWTGHAAPTLPHVDRGRSETQRWIVPVGLGRDGW
jgi:prepilin-type N-terminal cleavage/methylation domain-containing protein